MVHFGRVGLGITRGLRRQAFEEGLQRVFDATLDSSQSLSAILQKKVDEYGQQVFELLRIKCVADSHVLGQVGNELHLLICRMKQTMDAKLSRHDESVVVRQHCEQLLWKHHNYKCRRVKLWKALQDRLRSQDQAMRARQSSVHRRVRANSTSKKGF